MHPYLFASYLNRCRHAVNMQRIVKDLGARIDLRDVNRLYASIRRINQTTLKKVYQEHVKRYMRGDKNIPLQ
jgi:hypothetical protein